MRCGALLHFGVQNWRGLAAGANISLTHVQRRRVKRHYDSQTLPHSNACRLHTISHLNMIPEVEEPIPEETPTTETNPVFAAHTTKLMISNCCLLLNYCMVSATQDTCCDPLNPVDAN